MTEIAYAAFTDTATFMLDAEGLCRWVVPAPGARRTTTFSEELDSSERCVGAQYVASIDTRVQGGLVELPRVGCSLVFAAADAAGRISLIRTGALLRFEVKRKPDSGVHERPLAGPLAAAHSLPTCAGDSSDEPPELATTRFRAETALKGMLPRRPAVPKPLPSPPSSPARPSCPAPPDSATVRRTHGPSGGGHFHLPPPSPPPRRSPGVPLDPAGPRAAEPKFGGHAPRAEEDVRNVAVPANYWPGRRSGRTRRQA